MRFPVPLLRTIDASLALTGEVLNDVVLESGGIGIAYALATAKCTMGIPFSVNARLAGTAAR